MSTNRNFGLLVWCVCAVSGYDGPPSPPANVQIIACQDRRAVLTWDQPDADSAPVRLYKIQYSTSNTASVWYDAQTVGSQSTHVNLKLPANAEVWLRVFAFNAQGSSRPGEAPQRCTVPPSRPDKNPQSVVGKGTMPHNMIITWKGMPLVEHNGPDFHYVVKWRKRAGNQNWSSYRVSHPVTSFIVDNLPTYTAYDIIVQSENAIGTSVLVPRKITGYSGEDVPIVAPDNFRLTGRVKTTRLLDPDKTARFKWSPCNSSSEAVRGEFRGYRVHLIDRENRRRTWQSDFLNVRKNKDKDLVGIVGDLKPATKYVAYVTVLNNRFIGPPSNKVKFKTMEKAPGPVVQLNVVKSTQSSLVVAWYPPDVRNGEIVGYTYAYSELIQWSLGKGVDGQKMLSAKTNHIQINNLEPNATYRVYVYAHTKAGRGPAASIDARLELPEPPPNLPNDAIPPTVSSERTPQPTERISEEGSQFLEAVESSSSSTSTLHYSSLSWFIFISVLGCGIT